MWDIVLNVLTKVLCDRRVGLFVIALQGQEIVAPLVLEQGDRTILTRLLILSHSAFSAASTKTPHERRRAQVRTPGPGRVSTPVRWGR